MQDRVQREAFSRATTFPYPPLLFSTSFFQPRPISPLPFYFFFSFFLAPVNPLESIISARGKTRGKSGERGKEIYCFLVGIDTLDGFELDFI